MKILVLFLVVLFAAAGCKQLATQPVFVETTSLMCNGYPWHSDSVKVTRTDSTVAADCYGFVYFTPDSPQFNSPMQRGRLHWSVAFWEVDSSGTVYLNDETRRAGKRSMSVEWFGDTTWLGGAPAVSNYGDGMYGRITIVSLSPLSAVIGDLSQVYLPDVDISRTRGKSNYRDHWRGVVIE